MVSHISDASVLDAEIRADSTAFDVSLDGEGECAESRIIEPMLDRGMKRRFKELWICDDRVMLTQGAGNPAITISAIAARTGTTDHCFDRYRARNCPDLVEAPKGTTDAGQRELGAAILDHSTRCRGELETRRSLKSIRG